MALYRKVGFDGPLKTMTPKGFVEPNTNNALWGMRVFWPIKGEYRIAYLKADYSVAIIGRSALDYVWLLARKSEMSDADFERYRRDFLSHLKDIRTLRSLLVPE